MIVPVFNNATTIGRTLEAILAQRGDEDEIIVIDDGSTDASASVVERYPVRLLRNGQNRGAAMARNIAVREARGELLFFTDADAVLVAGALDAAHRALLDPGIAAVVGVYAAQCGHENAASVFKNFWIRDSYLRAGPSIDWLFGCVCAVRRSVFLEQGGFPIRHDAHEAATDIALGIRLHDAGHEILLSRQMEAIHLRRHSAGSLFLNDLRRAATYTTLALQHLGVRRLARRAGIANVTWGFVAGTALLAALLVVGLTSLLRPAPAPIVLFLLAAYLALHTGFYRRLHRHCGLAHAASGIGLLALSQLASSVGSAWGLLRLLTRRPPLSAAT